MADIQNTLAERGKTHGDYAVHAQVTQDIKSAIHAGRVCALHGEEPPALPAYFQETIDMIAHKLGRIAAGNPDFRDHWHDIAGYATLAADRCSDAMPVITPVNYTGCYTYKFVDAPGNLACLWNWVIFTPDGRPYSSKETEAEAIETVKEYNAR